MYQVKEMTDKEKFEMYMKCKKKKLVKMLIECNKLLDNLPQTIYNEYCIRELKKEN